MSAAPGRSQASSHRSPQGEGTSTTAAPGRSQASSQGESIPTTAAPDFGGVTAVLGDYFAGLRHSDTARLKRAFHPEAHYFCATDGTLLHLDMARYFPVVEQRPSPASQGHPPTDRILAIEFAGPVTAFAKLECSIPPRFFTDFLVLLKLDGRWQIVSKVFHYETRQE